MAAKFEIKRSSDGQFYFNLKAANGEVAVTSELYVGKSGATRGIESVRHDVPAPERFVRLHSKAGEPYFVLKAENHEPIGTSETYSSKAARDGASRRCSAAPGRRSRWTCEAFGLLPPHPSNPSTKAPIVALMKQARAYGVGVVVATQNPMDLDYRALSNAGLWCIGRLQTDADRARVIEGLSLSGSAAAEPKALSAIVKRLNKRWFPFDSAHDPGPRLLQPRWAYSFLRGPMTRAEIRRAAMLARRQSGRAA